MTMEGVQAASENWWCFRPDEEDQCAGAGCMMLLFRLLSRKNEFARGLHCIKREQRAASDVDVLFQPWDLPYLNVVCYPFSDGLKFTVTSSWQGGFRIDIGGHAIRVPKYLSALHPLVQMVLFAGLNSSRFGEDDLFVCPKSYVPRCVLGMVKNSAKGRPEGDSEENAQEINKVGNWRGLSSASRQLAGQVPITAQADSNNRMLGKAAQGQAASETDTTDWQQQQHQQPQQQGRTLTGGKHVAELGSPSAGFSIARDQGFLPACDQGEMEKDATKFQNISSSGLPFAATEYPNGQHFLKDDAELGGQQRDDGLQHDEPDNNLSGEETQVTTEHGISSTSLFMTTNTGTTTWLIASGALHHATGNRDLLCDFVAEHSDLVVKTGDAGAAPMHVVGSGSVVTDTVVLHDVWYVPGLAVNVVSVSQLTELDYSVAFGGGKCIVRSAYDGAVVGAARVGENGLFAMDFIRVPPGFL